MRWLLIACVVLAGCAGSRTGGTSAPESTRESDARDAGLARLLAATAAGDVGAVRALFADEVTFGGAWFDDEACRRHLASANVVAPAGMPELARCLATLPLARSARQSGFPGLAVVTYAPGIELEVLFAGTAQNPRLRWIGYVHRVEASDALPTITQAAFEALRVEPAPIALDAATEQALAAERAAVDLPADRVFSWFKICADATGVITRVQPRLTTSFVAQPALAAWVRTWKLRPFVLGAQPVPVCALVYVGSDPHVEDAQLLPAPVPTKHADAIIVSPRRLAKQRLEGDPAIVPDDLDKVKIEQAGRPKLVGTFLMCAGPDGAVASVEPVVPTGLPSYDRKIVRKLRGWRYRPFERDGRRLPFCSFLTFIYKQR